MFLKIINLYLKNIYKLKNNLFNQYIKMSEVNTTLNVLQIDGLCNQSGPNSLNPSELEKPNILGRAIFDKCVIKNATVQQLSNKALFNVVRALKNKGVCEAYMNSPNEANDVVNSGKIAGFMKAEASGNKAIFIK